MIQEIQPEYLANIYSSKMPKKGSLLVAFCENKIFMKQGKQIEYLPYERLEAWCKRKSLDLPDTVFLFSIGEEDYFLTDLPEEFLGEQEIKEYAYVSMFEVRSKTPKKKVFAAATAWHLYVWYRENRFCGRCGGKLVHSKGLRMLHCPSCKNTVFPKIAPAVIVGITDGDRILMTKYAGREYQRHALVAGFTEIGESAEETVQREVMEEVGLKVKNIRYYKSQPWGFDSNLLLGYFCELDGAGEIQMDEEELSAAEWVDYRMIEDDREELSLTREMMRAFREQREQQAH